MTSTNYRTMAGLGSVHWSTIEQKSKEGVSYIVLHCVTIENRDTGTRTRDLSHCFKVGKPPKLIVFGHNGLFNNGSCCYCALQGSTKSQWEKPGRLQLSAESISAFVKMSRRMNETIYMCDEMILFIYIFSITLKT